MGASAQASSSSETPLGPKLPLRLGRFTLCEELGAGGMATVYLARMEMAGGLERLAALKTIHPHLAKEKAFVDMFLDEARIASHVGHPNVCSSYDFGEVNGVYYLAMEYLLGEPLFDVINGLVERFDDAREVLPFLAARIIADAAEGLHAAHTSRGPDGERLQIVHRDVSPQNLFLTYEGSVKVVDFGCAKAAERVAHTSTGVMKGKVGYAAPEQLKSDHVDARADIWALGVCLWETLTLSPLFTRDTAVKTAMAVLEEEVELASDGRDWVPEGVAQVAARALRRDPSERFADAREMSRELRRFIADSGFTLESAELAEWMEFLFEDRREERIRQAARVRELDLADVSLYEVTAEDVELLESEPAPLEAMPIDEPHDEPGYSSVEASGPITKASHRAVASSREAGSEPPPLPANKGRTWLWVAASLLALGAGGYVLSLYYEPAPWLVEMLGMGPPQPTFTDLRGTRDADDGPASIDGVGVGPDDATGAGEGDPGSAVASPDDPAGGDEAGGDEGTADEGTADEDGARAGRSSDDDGSASGRSRGRSRSGRSGRGGGGGGRSSVTTVVSGGGGGGAGAYGGGSGTPGGSGTSGGSGTGSTGATGGSGSPTALQGDNGILRLETASGWAIVYANGRRLGRTPVRTELPAGRYRLRLLPYGEEPASQLPVHIEAGVENRLEIDVGPPPG
ncbi:MAG TPA: serine/threonine-protein kinase [Sandaracinaceae bacterium LLY-WYZ-13_1]|nr:serine/threonine-protein kinase [Sandaracinaceae bacterium LLY-WYZ-13_1]